MKMVLDGLNQPRGGARRLRASAFALEQATADRDHREG
jgi:hypothetical protein